MDNLQLLERLEYHLSINEVTVGLLNKAASNVAKTRTLKAIGTALNPFKNAAAKSNSLGRALRAGAFKQMRTGSGKMAANKVVNAAKNSAPARLAKVTKPVMNAARQGSTSAKNLIKRGATANAIANKPSVAMNNLKNQAIKSNNIPKPTLSTPKSTPVKSTTNKWSGLKKAAVGTAVGAGAIGTGYLGYKGAKAAYNQARI